MPQAVGVARAAGALADFRAAVAAAKGVERPAIVLTGNKQVDFVPTLRAVLVDPDRTGVGVDGQPLRVAVADGEQLRPCLFDADEGVICGDGPIPVEPDHRALMIVGLLRAVCRAAVTQRQIQLAGGIEADATAEVMGAIAGVRGLEHLRETDQCRAFEAAGPERRGLSPERSWTGVAQEHLAAVVEHVQHPALTIDDCFGHAGQRRRCALIKVDQQHLPGAFGDQQATGVDETHAPGVFEVGTDPFEPLGLRRGEGPAHHPDQRQPHRQPQSQSQPRHPLEQRP